MTIVDYNAGTVKDMGLAQAKVVTMDDKTTMEITLNPGFDWVKEVRIYLSIDRQKKQIADLGSPLLLPIGVPQAPRLPRVVPRQPFRLPPGRHNEGPVQGRLHRDGQRRLQLQHPPRCVRLEKSFIFVLKLWRLNIPRSPFFFAGTGHLPEVIGDVPCVMVEFSQSTAAVVKDMKD